MAGTAVGLLATFLATLTARTMLAAVTKSPSATAASARMKYISDVLNTFTSLRSGVFALPGYLLMIWILPSEVASTKAVFLTSPQLGAGVRRLYRFIPIFNNGEPVISVEFVVQKLAIPPVPSVEGWLRAKITSPWIASVQICG